MYVSRLVIRNFRNFKKLDVRLKGGVTCVIGENNSGKTNLFRALRLAIDVNLSSQFRQLMPHDIHADVDLSSANQVAAHKRELVAAKHHKAETQKFAEFWDSLSDEQQLHFEKMAVEGTDGLKRKNYYRTMGCDEQMFAQYRHIILCEHFKRTASCGIE